MKKLIILSIILSLYTLQSFAEKKIHLKAKTRQDLVNLITKSKYISTDKLTINPEIADELKIELWATSPQLFSPVAMDVDPQGRVWVVEGNNFKVNNVEAGNSIVVLEDSDNDGKADKSTEFVTEKNIRHAPLGIAVFDNKIILSATPDIIIYTDTNRNGIFEKGIDKREVFLTGFHGGRHDHTLHAVVGSPSGQWYFSHGNVGLNVKTKDGKSFISGCYYGSPQNIGKKSSDGHTYPGGVAFRINPDGTAMNVVGSNLRNTHDMFVNSMGDIFQNDNDDPANCRNSWLMEYGELGYSDLQDGSRSWEEIAKSWNTKAVKTRIRYRRSFHALDHWRTEYPGALPPDHVYGGGSPTGNYFIEGDELGESLRGTYLSADIVHRNIFSYKPQLKDAQIAMGLNKKFLSVNEDPKESFFFPTDITVAPDGSILVCDFYNGTTRYASNVYGSIYRISPKNKKLTKPILDFDSINGLLNALKNPNASVRWVAVHKLKEKGEEAVDKLINFYKTESNPYIKVRAIWVLAADKKQGKAYVEYLLKSDNEQIRIVAYRALRFFQGQELLNYAEQQINDPSASVRREIILSLRDVPMNEKKHLLSQLIQSYDGKNRWYLEAIGYASKLNEVEVYDDIIKPLINKPYKNWQDKAINLAWRMYTPNSLNDLKQVILEQQIKGDKFTHLLMGFASFRNDKERLNNKNTVEEFKKLALYQDEKSQQVMKEVSEKDLEKSLAKYLRENYIMPKAFGVETKVSDVKTITNLQGNAENGKLKIAACYSCHKIGEVGNSFGPNLSSWGKPRALSEIVEAIVEPSAKLAHGYEKPIRLTSSKGIAEGFLISDNYHAGSYKIKIFPSKFISVQFRGKISAKLEKLTTSWMPTAEKMGLKDQDVRDIAEYLKSL